MNFIFGNSNDLMLSDTELLKIMQEAYLDEGFIDEVHFQTSFTPELIRSRGTIYCARETKTNEIAGMIIAVDYTSPSKLFAIENEVEMHLLGVRKIFRNNGLGKLLIKNFIKHSQSKHYSKILLCTQINMFAAHRLYEGFDFVRDSTRDFIRGNRNFLFYEKSLITEQ